MTDQVVAQLLQMFPEAPVRRVPKIEAVTSPTSAGASASGQALSAIHVPMEVDARVERMVRLAILSSRAVILVGPPGTGKTTLLREVVGKIASDPAAYGFTKGPKDVDWVTPNENWTTSDLVGGVTIDNGELRFRPGKVLNAIKADSWLVLDEANRADMDRIFGGLLTWLSGQETTLDRVSTSVGSGSVRLGWSGDASSTVTGEDALESGSTASDVVYAAGTEWRLLGTYNALDAQRVFQFGHALGRRFLRVPIPAASDAQFRRALERQHPKLAPHLADGIVNLYAAHLGDPVTTLGPALFLRMPDYIQAGLATGSEELDTQADAASESEAAGNQFEAIPTSEDSVGMSTLERELLAESYLVNVGVWLGLMEDQYQSLESEIVSNRHVFSQSTWQWILDLAGALS